MSTNSSIEWTEATWNPVAGCTIVSPGCTNCYAMRMAARLEAMGQAKYVGTTKKVNGHAVWTGKINLDPDALLAPLSWKKPRRVFVNSMSDLFHEGVPFDYVDRVFAVMALTPQHTYQILTKRPERMAEYLNRRGSGERLGNAIPPIIEAFGRPAFNARARPPGPSGWPLPNVWLGTSVEDQKRADERIPHLLMCPAAVRFLSCEPLLGPVDLGDVTLADGDSLDATTGEICAKESGCLLDQEMSPIDWVIVGGESGPGARPCNVAWVRSIVDQCKAAGVACFVKQLGAAPRPSPVPSDVSVRFIKDTKGGDPAEWPEDLRVREFPRQEVPA